MQKIMFNNNYGLTDAVIEYIKTMTRRIIPDCVVMDYNEDYDLSGVDMEAFIHDHSRYKVGEIVAVAQSYKDIPTDCLPHGAFSIDAFAEQKGWSNKMFVKPDFMPHQIRITDIKVERLQDIGYEDCLKEGVRKKYWSDGTCVGYIFDNMPEDVDEYQTPQEAFAALIDKVSGKGTWAANPWVFAYEFELIK